MKDIIKIIVLLVILILMVAGFWYLFKDQKVFEHRRTNTEIKETVEEPKEEKKEEVLEQPKVEEKKEETKKEEVVPKQETKKVENKTTNSTTNSTQRKIKDYKWLSCETKEEITEDNTNFDYITYIFMASFPIYEGEEFSTKNELNASTVQILFRVNQYDTLSTDEKKIVDLILDETVSIFKGYSKKKTMNGNVVQFYLRGDKNAFLKSFDDFGSKTVTYSEYIEYFKDNKITCSEA